MPPSFSLLSPLRDVPIAVVDVETTGASAAWGDRVIEIGVARIENGRLCGQYQQVIDPRRRISPGITALTGITQAMCDGQPTFREQLPRLLEYLSGAVILGHNVRFDLSFLAHEFRRAGMRLGEALGSTQVLDTVRIARRRFGRGGNSLQRLAMRLGIDVTIAHRALADAQTTAGVFERMLEPAGGWSLSLADTILQQGGPMSVASADGEQSILPLELEEALEQRGTVMIEYLDACANRTTRLVEPIRLRRQSGEVTLVAHCHLRNELRHFKLERIVRIVREEPSPQPPPPEVAESQIELPR
jgi:DNA polymerase III epsilon subunit family exonuclease